MNEKVIELINAAGEVEALIQNLTLPSDLELALIRLYRAKEAVKRIL